MVNDLLTNRINAQISYLTSDDFQDFIVKLLLLVHGVNGFGTIRRSKDQGADGIIKSNKCVIACWGPEKADSSKLQKSFEKKASSDFKSYEKNWEAIYPMWQVFTNHQPSPEQIKFIEKLKSGSTIVGLEAITHMVQNLNSANKRKICDLLKIPQELVCQDFIGGLLEDILQSATDNKTINYPKPTYIPDKIKINFSEHEYDSILNEIEDCQQTYFTQIKDALTAFEENELTKIKRKIVCDFNMQNGGSFAASFNLQSRLYLHKYASDGDDDYRDIIRSLLFYTFEQCLIGKRVIM